MIQLKYAEIFNDTGPRYINSADAVTNQ
jgi:hypothetical protein